MGTVTQILRARIGAFGRLKNVHRLAAGLTVAASLAFTSASARAGLQEFPQDHQVLFSGDRAFAENPPIQLAGLQLSADRAVSADPLSIDPVSRQALLADEKGIGELALPNLTEVRNASAVVAAKADATQPLLIPLPRAAEAGLWGLAALVMFGAMKNLRRRLFA